MISDQVFRKTADSLLKNLILVGLFLLLGSAPTWAAVERLFEVSYETERGWTPYRVVPVTFAAQRELLHGRRTPSGKAWQKFALIPDISWSRDKFVEHRAVLSSLE